MSDPTSTTQPEEILSPEVAEAMGISQPAFEEVQCIVGRMPTVQELSTLLAMWEANGRQQSLYGWLRGQHHLVERSEYLYAGGDDRHKRIREPRVKDCIGLAHELAAALPSAPGEGWEAPQASTLLYMVGEVSTEFLDSEYARRCLHVVVEPMRMATMEEDTAYLQLILGSLRDGGVVRQLRQVGQGGLFATLVAGSSAGRGFDVLTCREIRLDSFLFGEEPGRFVVSLPEAQDDFFLLKLQEARVNCCFLGRVTKGRVVVDDMDFGDIRNFRPKTA